MEEGNEGRNRGVLVKQINYIRREKYLIFLPIDRRKEREGKEGEKEAEYSRLHGDATKAASGSIEAGEIRVSVCMRARCA